MKSTRWWMALGILLGLSGCGGGGASTPPTATNAPPNTDAGSAQSVGTGAAVTLTGTATDSDGSIASVLWVQTSGPVVALTGIATPTASFTAPELSIGESTTLEFQFSATDDGGLSASDSVQVTVSVPELFLVYGEEAPGGIPELWLSDLAPGSPPAARLGGRAANFALSPDSSRIAYLSDEDEPDVFELYSVRRDGTGLVKLNGDLVAGGGVSATYRWAPDASRVLYRADQDEDDVFELYTVRPDGTGRVKLTDLDAKDGDALVRSYEWAADASRIAYRAVEVLGREPELFSVRPDGTGRVTLSGDLVAGGSVTDFRWAPDASRIAYRADQDTDNVFELYAVRPDGTGRVTLNGDLLPSNGDVSTYQWAPDASRVAYVADQDQDGVLELYSVRPDGTGRVKLNGDLGVDGDVSAREWGWAPDASRVSYQAEGKLYTVRPDGTGRVQLNGDVAVLHHRWAPDASRIAYTSLMGELEVYSERPDGTGRVRLASRVPSWDWAPDGSRVACLTDEDRDGVNQLYSVRGDGTGRVKLNGELVPNGRVWSWEWSPDSSHVAYRADQEIVDVFHLYARRADGAGTALNVSRDLVGSVHFSYQWGVR